MKRSQRVKTNLYARESSLPCTQTHAPFECLSTLIRQLNSIAPESRSTDGASGNRTQYYLLRRLYKIIFFHPLLIVFILVGSLTLADIRMVFYA